MCRAVCCVVNLQPTAAQQRRAVILAIRDIIWRCVPAVSGVGRSSNAVLALRGSRAAVPRSAAYPPDGFTECILLQRCGGVLIVCVLLRNSEVAWGANSVMGRL